VEANDAVTVASMTKPKSLPNEALSDLAVCAATKLQCYRVNSLISFFLFKKNKKISVVCLQFIYVHKS
jgi:hypothetical protein